MMDKHQRQQKITQLVRGRRIANQAELVQALEDAGIACTQASVSRDLAELGVVKTGGYYRTPQVEPGQSSLVDRLTVDRCGDNLVVVRTGPGHATAAALTIDKAKLPGVIGTVAGDDTIFIAVRSQDDQNRIVRRLIALFQN